MAAPYKHAHIEYVEQILSLKREVSTLLTLFPDNTDVINSIDRELTSLIDIVPTPSISLPHLLTICLTHSEFIQRIASLDRRITTLFNSLNDEIIAFTQTDTTLDVSTT
jgi:hypothetical protein